MVLYITDAGLHQPLYHLITGHLTQTTQELAPYQALAPTNALLAVTVEILINLLPWNQIILELMLK